MEAILTESFTAMGTISFPGKKCGNKKITMIQITRTIDPILSFLEKWR
jgi:hypothetical protein